MEEKITFESGKLRLEGLYNKLGSSHGIVITHPHPLYGGDMSNPVVESLATCFSKKNCTTLRFNFRGVGSSDGSYDNGDGEQDDIFAAINFLQNQGIEKIVLAGYSFGSWVIAKMSSFPDSVTGMLFVAPPIALLPFNNDYSNPLLKLVVTGEDDEIAPVDLIKESVTSWNPETEFCVIDFADHFFFGHFPALESTIQNHLETFFA